MEVYRSMVRNRIQRELGTMRLRDIQPRHLAAFMDKVRTGGKVGKESERVGPATLGKYYRFLHLIFKEALYRGLVASNPVANIRPPEGERTTAKCLSQDDIHKVIKAIGDEPLSLRLAFTLALTTGLRRGEIIGLRWSDIDMETGTIRVERSAGRSAEGQDVKPTKTAGSVRTVYATPQVLELLKGWRKEAGLHVDDYVFVWADGDWWHIDFLTRAWRKFMIRHELKPINFHGARHTAASVLLAQGVPMPDVAEVLGHSTPATTARVYSHVLGKAAERARDVMTGAYAPKSAPNGAEHDGNKHEN